MGFGLPASENNQRNSVPVNNQRQDFRQNRNNNNNNHIPGVYKNRLNATNAMPKAG